MKNLTNYEIQRQEEIREFSRMHVTENLTGLLCWARGNSKTMNDLFETMLDCKFKALGIDRFYADDDCYDEVYDLVEWPCELYAVTPWLAARLEEKGEAIIDLCGLRGMWARLATGQDVSMDSVIISIYNDLNNLLGRSMEEVA